MFCHPETHSSTIGRNTFQNERRFPPAGVLWISSHGNSIFKVDQEFEVLERLDREQEKHHKWWLHYQRQQAREQHLKARKQFEKQDDNSVEQNHENDQDSVVSINMDLPTMNFRKRLSNVRCFLYPCSR